MLKLIIVCNLICSVFSEFNGPFLLWGRKELNNKNVPALEMIDDDFLQNLYSESRSIVIFMKNISTALNEDNFPIVKELLNDNNQWVYLPQIRLQSDPIDFNANVQVINLMGSESEQDLELSTVYKNAINKYGNGNVLAILANKLDNKLHKRREIGDKTFNLTNSTHHSHTHLPYAIKHKNIFLCINDTIKTILFTTTVPILMDLDTNIKTKLESIDWVEGEYTDDFSILIVSFNGDRNGESVNIIVRFRFTIRNGYWALNEAEVEEDDMTSILTAVNPPVVPLRFSYVCKQRLRFKNETMTLTLENVQIQPEIESNPLRFNDPIDCVGFTTAPIWSGIFVSSILLFVLTIAITCIMDIKSPNRFETIRSKQLQFITQE